MSIMSVNQSTPNSKVQKSKRGSMNRPNSAVDGDVYLGFRADLDNDASQVYRTKLHNLFRQIEREFDILYQENQACECFWIYNACHKNFTLLLLNLLGKQPIFSD